MAPLIPTFDDDREDVQILEAYERVRANKIWTYGFDDRDDNAALEQQGPDRDEQQESDERLVYDNFATTIPGVVARLLLLIPCLDNSRWVDRGLAEQGFLALYRERHQLDGHAQQAVLAVHELLHMDWQQAVADYEKSRDDFDLVLTGKGLIDSARFTGDRQDPFLQVMEEHMDACEDRFSNVPIIQRLVRTLAPDHEAYLQKVQIILKEGFQDDATPWLARDTNFLVGRIDRSTGES